MKSTQILVISVALMLPIVACSNHRSTSDSRQSKLEDVALLVDSGSVEKVRIVHAPPMEHPFQITLDALSTDGPYVLQLSGAGLGKHSRDLARALRNSAVSGSGWSGDVNWAIVVYARGGREVLKIGFDESGRNGYLGSDAVRLDNTLKNWARELLPE